MAKKVLLSDLFPLRSEVTLKEGTDPIEVRPLKFPELVAMIIKHSNGAMALYNESQKPNPQYELLVAAMPQLVTDIICAGAEMEDQRESVEVLPPGPQLQLLATIWELSVPDPKKLIESLSKLMAQARRLASTAKEMAVAAAPAPVQASSQPAEPSSVSLNDSTTTS